MRGVFAALVLASGCSRLLGLDGPVARPDADADAREDGSSSADAPSGCWPSWLSGAPQLSAPVLVAAVSTSAQERDPVISSDGLTLHFNRMVSGAQFELFAATRSSTADPFGPPAPIAELNTATSEGRLATTADGLVGVFFSNRAPSVGGPDLWMTTRSSTVAPYGTPSTALLAQVNSSANEFDPELTPDGLTLYYSVTTSLAGQVIKRTTRASLADAFGAPVVVAGIAPTTSSHADPALSPDERVMVYAADDGVDSELYFATRASAADPFSGNSPLAALDSTADEGDADLTTDGCQVYFFSARSGSGDIYVADVVGP